MQFCILTEDFLVDKFRRIPINKMHRVEAITVGSSIIVPYRRIGLVNVIFVCKNKCSMWVAGEGGEGKCKGSKAVGLEQGT